MNKLLFSACLLLVVSGPVVAQQSLVGKYTGSFVMPTNRGDENWGLTLEILSAKGDAVEGLAQRAGKGGCVGDYPVAGTAKAMLLRCEQRKRAASAAIAGFGSA